VRAVRTVKLGQADARPEVAYAAEIRARTESDLGFRVGGKLVERSVDLGQAVKPGQVLARLDAQDLQLGQASAQAAEAAARTNLDLASANLQRFQSLYAQGSSARPSWSATRRRRSPPAPSGIRPGPRTRSSVTRRTMRCCAPTPPG
jgi:multidrug efflux pump subunit AcrA (membrane-fusion protein)